VQRGDGLANRRGKETGPDWGGGEFAKRKRYIPNPQFASQLKTGVNGDGRKPKNQDRMKLGRFKGETQKRVTLFSPGSIGDKLGVGQRGKHSLSKPDGERRAEGRLS